MYAADTEVDKHLQDPCDDLDDYFKRCRACRH